MGGGNLDKLMNMAGVMMMTMMMSQYQNLQSVATPKPTTPTLPPTQTLPQTPTHMPTIPNAAVSGNYAALHESTTTTSSVRYNPMGAASKPMALSLPDLNGTLEQLTKDCRKYTKIQGLGDDDDNRNGSLTAAPLLGGFALVWTTSNSVPINPGM